MKIIDFRKLANSFKFAFQGLKFAFSGQSFRIMCFFGILAIILMIVLGLSFQERIILILSIALVLSLELINSQIEKILDILQPNHDQRIKIIKDMSAAAVLIVSLTALLIGILIFLPYILKTFS
jgi:diacylglycerol kinase